MSWGGFEHSEGQWQAPPFLTRYLNQAIANRFRLRLPVATLSAPPRWFLDGNPDARIRNAAGEFSTSDLSFWYPGLEGLLAEKTDRLFDVLARSRIMAATDFIFVDLGPAGEPIYPAPWTMHEKETHGPWFYDEHAAKAFAGAMRGKYSALAVANRAWGTDFPAWDAVRLPRLGEHPGALWQDALVWYRDSKRHFIRWQVANYRRALNKYAGAAAPTRLVIMVPGSHVRADDWLEAAHSGNPDRRLTIMTDSEFLLELAKETNCWLQYTGVENEEEVHYLRSYMQAHGINQPMWGENAGTPADASNPHHLAEVVRGNGLYGLEYVNSQYFFEADGTTPTPTFAAAQKAFGQLRRAWS